MNKKLLYSTILSTLVILFIINNNYVKDLEYIYILYFLGIITSILNHGTCYKICKYLDRIVIVYIFLFILFNNIHKKLLLFILILAGLSYIYSKISKQIIYHYISHYLSTIILYLLH